MKSDPTSTSGTDYDRRWIVMVLKAAECMREIPDDIKKYIYRKYLTTMISAPWVPPERKIRIGGFCGKHRIWMSNGNNPMDECRGCWDDENMRILWIKKRRVKAQSLRV
jgi:hypothetical protein